MLNTALGISFSRSQTNYSAIAITVEMYFLRLFVLTSRFGFCFLHMFAFSHKDFMKKGEHTSIFKSALDAFNIFDLFIEVWRNMRWLFLAVVLRRPYVRNPEDARFDIYDALNGKRDVGVYGNHETYAMLNVPHGIQPQGDEPAPDYESGLPASLAAGKLHHLEGEEVPRDTKEYSSAYGDDRV